MRILILLVMFLSLGNTWAQDYEFKHFKLTPKFKDKLKNKSEKDMSPMLEKVWDSIKDIGIRQINKITEDILEFNQDFSLGGDNSPDVNWSKGIDADINVKIGRRVEPTLDSHRWIVRDQLVISVSATAFLKKMRDEGEIEISKDELNLFAGIQFSRRYAYSHFSTSYLNGLKSNFQKLLLSFNYFRLTNFTDIEDGDVISKEDMMSADINYSLSTPSMYFMAGYGKSSIYFSKMSSLTYHRPLPENRYGELDTIRMNHNVSKLVGAGLQVGLQADFYELLNLSLLGAEYRINYTKSSSTNMTFGDRDLVEIKTDYKLESAFSKINRGKDPRKIDIVQEYITTKEEGTRVSEELNLFALMWGKHVGNSTEELVFETRYGLRYLYRHSHESVSLVKSLWQSIFSADNVSKFSSRLIDNMAFEYEAYDPSIPFDEVYLDFPANFSFRMSKEYTANKNRKKFRSKALNLISEFKNMNGDIRQAFDAGDIKAPFMIDLNAQVGASGVVYMLETPADIRMDAFSKICSGKIISFDDASRKVKRCMESLAKTFAYLYGSYQSDKKVHLATLKTFFKKVSKSSRSFADLKLLFHEDNVQLYGLVQAATYNPSMNFKTYFKEGPSQGYGVIKDFIRNLE